MWTRRTLTSQIHDRELKRCAATYFKGRLIDIGCGSKPYKGLLAPYVNEHIGVDRKDTKHSKSNIDLFGTAYEIPARNASFDCAICTMVLEHLEEPELALRECHRVLKPGGVAIYSVPFIWHVHEAPRDFYRFSKYGLRYLFQKVGFDILELNALSGFWLTFGVLSVYNLNRFNRGPVRWLRIISRFGSLIQSISYSLERIDKTEQWTSAYMLVAKKNEYNGTSTKTEPIVSGQ
jgi:SAM-dependent methyltransferase